MILNNDLHSMLAYEQRIAHGWDEEWERENQETMKEAQAIMDNPDELVEADEIMARSIRHSDYNANEFRIFTGSGDEEQIKHLRDIEYAAAYTLLPDAIEVAGYELMQKRDYSKWVDVLLALKYVPLQKAFCYDLKRHEDYVGLLNTINPDKLAYPRTFFMALLAHWFEWLSQVGGNIWSYEDLSRVYNNKRKAQSLKKEAAKIREEWLGSLDARISEFLDLLLVCLKPEEMLAWATKEPLRQADRDNDYANEHDRCLKLIWKRLVEIGALQHLKADKMNLNLLALLAEKSVEEENLTDARIILNHLEQQLLNENFTGMGVITSVDAERQMVFSKMLRLLCKTQNDVEEVIQDFATRFFGWDVDYQQVYKESRREAYFFCCLLRQFEHFDKLDPEKSLLWKETLNLYLKEYRRCDNEYILGDEYALPFKLAMEVVESYMDEASREFLHAMLIENVLSIVSLLSIFSYCELRISRETIETLLKRIENEWPSARLLMEIRGQRALMLRIDGLVKQIKKV